jgi:hypothetical protein
MANYTATGEKYFQMDRTMKGIGTKDGSMGKANKYQKVGWK